MPSGVTKSRRLKESTHKKKPRVIQEIAGAEEDAPAVGGSMLTAAALGRRSSTRAVPVAGAVRTMPRRNSLFATAFPTVASVRHLFLDDTSKITLQQLFDLLDKTNSGILQPADFAPGTGPQRGQQLWLQLQGFFDQNHDGAITPLEYVDSFKALAMKQSLDMPSFARVPSTNLELLECLQLSANTVVRSLALQLFNTVGEALPPSTSFVLAAPMAFWTEYPTTPLLTLKGLFITDESYAVLGRVCMQSPRISPHLPPAPALLCSRSPTRLLSSAPPHLLASPPSPPLPRLLSGLQGTRHPPQRRDHRA